MSGRFADLKALQTAQNEDLQQEAPPTRTMPTQATPTQTTAARPGTAARAAAPAPSTARPWEQPGEAAEPVKALNGRVPRSVRLEFDRTLIDAVGTLREDVTVDLAVEALVRLLNDDVEVRERWLQRLWTLKHG